MGYYCYLTLNMEHLIVWVEVDGISGDVGVTGLNK